MLWSFWHVILQSKTNIRPLNNMTSIYLAWAISNLTLVPSMWRLYVVLSTIYTDFVIFHMYNISGTLLIFLSNGYRHTSDHIQGTHFSLFSSTVDFEIISQWSFPFPLLTVDFFVFCSGKCNNNIRHRHVVGLMITLWKWKQSHLSGIT